MLQMLVSRREIILKRGLNWWNQPRISILTFWGHQLDIFQWLKVLVQVVYFDCTMLFALYIIHCVWLNIFGDAPCVFLLQLCKIYIFVLFYILLRPKMWSCLRCSHSFHLLWCISILSHTLFNWISLHCTKADIFTR